MELRTLAMFLDVVREGSFAAAARRSDCDPSSVSRAMAGLERELQATLFHRSSRQLSLTAAGLAFRERITPLVSEFEAALAATKDAGATPRGRLRVTASVAFGVTRIIPLLPQFEADYSDVKVELVLTDAVVDLVAERIDLAVRLAPFLTGEAVARKVTPTRYRLCASADYVAAHGAPTSPQDLARHRCLAFALPQYRTAWQLIDPEGQRHEAELVEPTVISSALGLREAARLGLGIALLADWLVDEDLASGALIHCLPEYRVRATAVEPSVWLVRPDRAYTPRALEVFADFLAERLRRPGGH